MKQKKRNRKINWDFSRWMEKITRSYDNPTIFINKTFKSNFDAKSNLIFLSSLISAEPKTQSKISFVISPLSAVILSNFLTKEIEQIKKNFPKLLIKKEGI